MRVIYKYPLEITDRQMLLMKRGAQILHVDWQGEREQLSLWAEVDEALAPDDTEARVFLVVGTGNPFACDDPWTSYVGTALQFGGSLVWHVYEELVPLIEPNVSELGLEA